MNFRKIPENVKDYLKYDSHSKSGLVWVKKSGYCVKLNTSAGSYGGKKTYKVWKVVFKGKSYVCSRVIWFLLKNIDPEHMEIDHIDGNSCNNNIDNLRLIKKEHNAHNRKKPIVNTSGYTGVQLMHNGRSWASTWWEDGKQHHKYFGVSKNGYELAKQLAIAFRKEKLLVLNKTGAGYTTRHGYTVDLAESPNKLNYL
jgi:hypothetical protein